MNKPITRTPYRHSDATLGENHPDIQDEPETDITDMPEGIFDCEPETGDETFWRQFYAQDGKDF